MPKPSVHHMPVCPFWRLKVLEEDLVLTRHLDEACPWPPRNKYGHCATDAELGL